MKERKRAGLLRWRTKKGVHHKSHMSTRAFAVLVVARVELAQSTHTEICCTAAVLMHKFCPTVSREHLLPECCALRHFCRVPSKTLDSCTSCGACGRLSNQRA